jgi:hypothetical protein
MMHFAELFAQSEAKARAARVRRRSYPIHFYGGKNGSSKSMTAIFDTLPDLEAGTPVLSTVRLLDYKNPRVCDDPECRDVMHGRADHMAAHPSYVPFTSWHQLMDWKNGPVLMDEITGVADSNEGAAMPSAAANKLAQLRRDDCTVRVTGLSFIRANKRIREAVTAVTRCKSFWSTSHFNDDGSERMWMRARLAVVSTFDAQTLPVDDHTENAYEKADRIVSARHWIPKNPAIHAYDSLAPVLMVGHVSDAGRCVNCDGVRRAPACQCPDYTEKLPSRGAGRSASAKHEHRTAPEGQFSDSGLLIPATGLHAFASVDS